MISPVTPQTLEGKCEQALIAVLSAGPGVEGVKFAQNADEGVKLVGQVTVTASRGPESVPTSGIFDVQVSVEFKVLINRANRSLDSFNSARAGMGWTLEQDSFFMADLLSSAVPSFHCYYYVLQGSDVTPDESEHRIVWTCLMQAMPIDYGQDQKESPPQPPS